MPHTGHQVQPTRVGHPPLARPVTTRHASAPHRRINGIVRHSTISSSSQDMPAPPAAARPGSRPSRPRQNDGSPRDEIRLFSRDNPRNYDINLCNRNTILKLYIYQQNKYLLRSITEGNFRSRRPHGFKTTPCSANVVAVATREGVDPPSRQGRKDSSCRCPNHTAATRNGPTPADTLSNQRSPPRHQPRLLRQRHLRLSRNPTSARTTHQG